MVGLELGADDYVVKPFSGAEVIARMRAVLRRVKPAAPAPSDVVIGPLRVEFGSRRAFLDGDELALSRKEFDLLAELVAHAGRGRHARGPDLARVGRELVRVDQDAGRPRRLAAREARRRRVRAALAAHRARRRLPLHGAVGMGVLTLRARLVLVLAYVLVLAIGSMLVPLVRSRARPDRGRGVAGGRSGRPRWWRRPRPATRPTRRSWPRPSARRGARAGADRRRARRGAWRTPRPAASARTTRRGRRSRRRCAARTAQDERDSATLDERDPGHGGAGGARRAAGRRGADHPERRRGRPRGVVGDARARARGRDRAGARAGGGRVPGGVGRAAAAAAGVRRAAGGRGRPVRAGGDRGLARAARGRRRRSTR